MTYKQLHILQVHKELQHHLFFYQKVRDIVVCLEVLLHSYKI